MECPSCRFENPTGTRFCGNCGASLDSAPKKGGGTRTSASGLIHELQTGTTFAGRYQVIEELGRGGMGRVYKVIDEKIKEKIALKLLKPEISGDEQAIERFSNELRLSRKISHRHVCRMFDLGEVEGTHYITMEYVSGEDLKSILRMMGPMSAGKVVLIARQVCEGLAEAHRLGVIHRDLKPQNLMIDREGNVRIMDFGIARSLKVKGMTGAGVVVGTPEYMSPEQIEGQEVDNRSDIYSLGIILYEMATGRLPFEGETFLSIALKQKTEAPRDPRELNPQIPDDLDRLILRCLEKTRERRYQKVEDIEAELARIEKGVPTTEKVLPSVRPSTSREITVKLRPRKLVLPAAGLAVLAVALIFGVRLFSHKKAAAAASGKPSLAVVYFENNTGDAALDHWRKALPELVITDLSQSKYVNVLSGDEIYEILARLGQAEARTYSAGILQQVARNGGVNHVLSGGLTKAGDSFRVDYRLKAFGSGETVGTGSVSGEGLGSFYAMIDSLTRKVKADLKLTQSEIAGDIDLELGKITTSSPEAYALYIEGRDLHHKSDYTRSIETMKRALVLDPGFALAYRSMAMSYSNSYLYGERNRCLEKALSLRDRVSQKERLLLEAEYYTNKESTTSKAIEAYEQLLKTYPDDSFALTKLGQIYGNLEVYDKSIEYSEAAIRAEYRTYYPYSYIASAHEALGQPEKAEKVLRDFIRDVGDSPSVRSILAEYAAFRFRFPEALDEIDRALALTPNAGLLAFTKGEILIFQGDWVRAAAEFNGLLESKDPVAPIYGLGGLHQLAMHKGRFAEAIALADKAAGILEKIKEENFANFFRYGSTFAVWASGRRAEALERARRLGQSGQAMESPSWERLGLLLQGLILCDDNAPGKAKLLVPKLSSLCRASLDPQNPLMVEILLGAIDLQEGNATAAVARLKPACGRLFQQSNWISDSHALYFEQLAQALERAGSLDEARGEHERITTLTAGRLRFGHFYARSYYHLGLISERQGNKAKAVEHYRKFLELWKDADAGLPEVMDARKRLAGLQGA